jgi:uncharacterized membrane protein YraQ (UPF0718 family)
MGLRQRSAWLHVRALLFVLVMLSVVGLMLGASLIGLLRSRAQATVACALDGLLLGVLPALVLTRLLPHACETLGVGAIGLAAVGFGLFALARRAGHSKVARLGGVLLVPALSLHALTDGAALAMSASGRIGLNGWVLASAVVLHRAPEGLLAASTRREQTLKTALMTVLPLALATVCGALLGERLQVALSNAELDALLALASGAVLQHLSHQHSPPPSAAGLGNALAGAAFLGGIGLVMAIPGAHDALAHHQPRELSIAGSFLPLFIETAPSILLGLLAAGALHVWARPWLTGWLRGGSGGRQALRGMLFGMPLPVCSCGVLPMTQRMLKQGLPAAAVISFALATPELGADSALLSLRLLGVDVTVARLLGSALFALVVALVVARFAQPSAASEPPSAAVPPPTAAGARAWLAEAFGPALDHNAAWLVLGLLIAAALEAGLDPSWLSRIAPPWDVGLAALLAVPLYVCAQAATPLAAVLLHKGASLAAVLALLWIGPATNLPLLGVLRRALGMRAAIAFALTSLAWASALAFFAQRFTPLDRVPEVHPLVAHAHHPLEWVAALLLAALLVASLLRLGPRAWFAAMGTGLPASTHAHDHAQAGCSHDSSDASAHAHQHA